MRKKASCFLERLNSVFHHNECVMVKWCRWWQSLLVEMTGQHPSRRLQVSTIHTLPLSISFFFLSLSFFLIQYRNIWFLSIFRATAISTIYHQLHHQWPSSLDSACPQIHTQFWVSTEWSPSSPLFILPFLRPLLLSFSLSLCVCLSHPLLLLLLSLLFTAATLQEGEGERERKLMIMQ